jgi:OOP family OmpA-OmpF porin
MKTTRAALPAIIIIVALAGCHSMAPQYDFEPASMAADGYVARVDGFQIIADNSLSMADRTGHMNKYDIVGGLVGSLGQSIPPVGFQGSLRSFGQGSCVSKAKDTDLLIEPMDFSSSRFVQWADKFHCSGGYSPLDAALDGAGRDLAGMKGDVAVVVISDGRHMGMDEIEAARRLSGQYGDRLCLYPVAVGADAKGLELLRQLAEIAGCGEVYDVAALNDAAGMKGFVEKVFVEPDSDGDGVPDRLDKCPGTPKGVTVDAVGCPIDTDGDGVPDYLDKCPGTPRGVKVDDAGCPIDSDGDGVPDHLDKCPGTPAGVKVDSHGCPLDSDGDGVPDHLDKCPDTPKGAVVDEHGCQFVGVTRDGNTYRISGRVLFDVNKAVIKPEIFPALNRLADELKKSDAKIEVQGHTDKSGPRAYNEQLSLKRANAAMEYLVGRGIDAGRMTAKGFAWDEPLVANDTEENRAKNRRVDFLIIE